MNVRLVGISFENQSIDYVDCVIRTEMDQMDRANAWGKGDYHQILGWLRWRWFSDISNSLPRSRLISFLPLVQVCSLQSLKVWAFFLDSNGSSGTELEPSSSWLLHLVIVLMVISLNGWLCSGFCAQWSSDCYVWLLPWSVLCRRSALMWPTSPFNLSWGFFRQQTISIRLLCLIFLLFFLQII